MDTKICSKCKQDKPIDLFTHRAGKPLAKCYACRPVEKTTSKLQETHLLKKQDLDHFYGLRRRYNISIQEYIDMFTHPSCAGCGAKENDNGLRLFVDHCHNSNIVRGLLCHGCNLAIGGAKDNIQTLKNLISYLEAFEAITAAEPSITAPAPAAATSPKFIPV